MRVRLPAGDVAFYLAAAGQLPPPERSLFQDRVNASLRAHPDPGPGDVNRAIRARAGWAVVPPRPPRQRNSKRSRQRDTNGSQV
jgi:hypothetical protein